MAPGIVELLALRPEGSSMIGAILGLTVRALMQLARSRRQDAISVLRAWISRRRE